ncbi:MAG: DNA-protecting protein DprA [Epulopiscium sp.]|nr:DNA-protecting protein DprA [Candidatus Epulonipiscium sp.]
MEYENFWIWFTRIPGIGNRKQKKLLDVFGTPENVWKAEHQDLSQYSNLSPKDISAIIQSKDFSKIQKWIEELIQKNIQFYSIEHPQYPDLLKKIYDPPYGIYVKGKNFGIVQPTVGVVGARHCSEYGKQMAFHMGKELASMGISIISGMARGVDSAAHQGALAGGGHTLAILGNGVDICYPEGNKRLYMEIMDKGALLSEFPPGTMPKPGFFPLRNRIISGLSQGLLVVEAAKRSGSLITADQALEQGRDVYAIPGNITSSLSAGTNYLIQQGAKLVMKAEDILEDLCLENPFFAPQKEKNSKSTPKEPLEKEEKIVYDCLSLEPVSIDQICEKTGYSPGMLQHILLILELKDRIKKLSNQWFVRKDN